MGNFVDWTSIQADDRGNLSAEVLRVARQSDILAQHVVKQRTLEHGLGSIGILLRCVLQEQNLSSTRDV